MAAAPLSPGEPASELASELANETANELASEIANEIANEIDGMKLAAARLWATHRFPYLASAVFAAPTLPAPGLERIMIDRWWRIHADPAAVENASVDELGGELLHLISHVLRDHAGRADAKTFSEPEELHHWVDAVDAEIADDFPTDVGRVSPSVSPADLVCEDGRLAEEYYRRGVVREQETNDCGSGAHGHSPVWEPPPPTDENDHQGVGEDDQQLIRHNVAAEIARTDADAVSAGLRRWADDQLHSRVDWRAELAASIRRAVSSAAGAVDYSYRRPSRRASVSDGVVLPSLQRPTVEVAVVCDTSASVSDELLGQAMTEVDGLLRAIGTRTVSVLAVDDAVRVVTKATNGRDVLLLGGGGTDMEVGIGAAMQLRPAPQVIVVLTDGYTPWPERPPQASVIAGILVDDNGGLVPPDNPPRWVRSVPIVNR